MSKEKTPEWVFDVILAAMLGYTSALYFNDIWTGFWQPLIGIILAFATATIVAMICAYVMRHWKP